MLAPRTSAHASPSLEWLFPFLSPCLSRQLPEEIWGLALGPPYGLQEFARDHGGKQQESPPPPQQQQQEQEPSAQGASQDTRQVDPPGPRQEAVLRRLHEAEGPDSDDEEEADETGRDQEDDWTDGEEGPVLEPLGLSEEDEEEDGDDDDDETGRAEGVAAGSAVSASRPRLLKSLCADLRKTDDASTVLQALKFCERLVRAKPEELGVVAVELARSLLHCRTPEWVEGTGPPGNTAEDQRLRSMVAVLALRPEGSGEALAADLFTPHLDMSQRLLALDTMCLAAHEISSGGAPPALLGSAAPTRQPLEAGARSTPESSVNGKTRVWGHTRLRQLREGSTLPRSRRNTFPEVALRWTSALLGAVQDRAGSKGIDLFGRDFVVLGRLLGTIGTFVECSGHSLQTPRLAAALLELLQAPAVAGHPEAFVRRAALMAGAQVLTALPPAALAGPAVGGVLLLSLGRAVPQ